MPVCSLVYCRSKILKKKPKLTLHRFPQNESMREKWIETIGAANLKSHKSLFLCSLHFEATSFYTEHNLKRIRADALPSLFLQMQPKTELERRLLSQNQTAHSYVNSLPNQDPKDGKTNDTAADECSDPIEDDNTSDSDEVLDPAAQDPSDNSNQNNSDDDDDDDEELEIQKLKKTCEDQRETIKKLRDQVRRRNAKIKKQSEEIKQLRNNNILDWDDSLLLNEFLGPKGKSILDDYL